MAKAEITVHVTDLPKFKALAAENERLRGAIDKALHELGVPDESYPAPVANAVRILDDTRKNVDD